MEYILDASEKNTISKNTFKSPESHRDKSDTLALSSNPHAQVLSRVRTVNNKTMCRVGICGPSSKLVTVTVQPTRTTL